MNTAIYVESDYSGTTSVAIELEDSQSITHCAVSCLKSDTCQAFSYQSVDLHCSLLMCIDPELVTMTPGASGTAGTLIYLTAGYQPVITTDLAYGE